MGLNQDDIKALISILQKGLENDDEPQVATKPKKPRAKRTKKKVENRENKFLSMKEKDMHKKDVLIDKKLNVSPPTERSRQFNPVKVQCVVCGKKETVSPTLMKDRSRYKCNKCSAAAG